MQTLPHNTFITPHTLPTFGYANPRDAQKTCVEVTRRGDTYMLSFRGCLLCDSLPRYCTLGKLKALRIKEEVETVTRHVYNSFMKKEQKKSACDSSSHTSHPTSENPNSSTFEIHS